MRKNSFIRAGKQAAAFNHVILEIISGVVSCFSILSLVFLFSAHEAKSSALLLVPASVGLLSGGAGKHTGCNQASVCY